VRVTAEECDLDRDVGTVVSVSETDLCTSIDGKEHTCPLSALQRVDLSVRHRTWWESAEKGLIVGAGVGLAALGAMLSRPGYHEDNEIWSGFKVAGITAAAGLAIGTVVGVVRGRDVWEPISVRLTPDGRLGIGISFTHRRQD
jgi:hypothetical protein